MSHSIQTGFLFARPSWLSGFARVLDLFGVFDVYSQSRTPGEADARAMYADWKIVGQDIMEAVSHFDSEEPHISDSSNDKIDNKQLPLFAR